MNAHLLVIEPDASGRMTGQALSEALNRDKVNDDVFAVVATAGTTNLGVIDELSGIAEVCRSRELWMHVDAAYGGAALAAASTRKSFIGIERADSFIVDPHKWLFAPFDCCALMYRNPHLARIAHTQRAGYLEPLQQRDDWNPSDYAIHLSRRARGLPFWFSLAAHGTLAYAEAIEHTLTVARLGAAEIRSRDYLELLTEPALTILVFRRLGWQPEEYQAWSERLLSDGLAFVTPTTHDGETVMRIAVVSPRTSLEDLIAILDTMA
jgi:glutamate/tyrosine decarboxylase-like PLP-dependent enzyme